MIGPNEFDLLALVRERKPVELLTRDGLTRFVVYVLSRAVWDDQDGLGVRGLMYMVGVQCSDIASEGEVVYLRYDPFAQKGAFITAVEFREFAERAITALRQESDETREHP